MLLLLYFPSTRVDSVAKESREEAPQGTGLKAWGKSLCQVSNTRGLLGRDVLEVGGGVPACPL